MEVPPPLSHYALLVELRGVNSIAKDLMPALERAMDPFFSDCDGGWSVEEQDEAYEEGRELPLRCGHRAHKWDWWRLGGRYRDRLQVVERPSEPPAIGEPGVPEAMAINRGEEEYKVEGVDAARKRDIDWERMAAARREWAAQSWDKYAEKAATNGDAFYRLVYGVEEGDDRDTYIRRRTNTFSAYALLLADGTWVPSETYIPGGKGQIGRFEKTPDFDRLMQDVIAKIPDDAVLAIVDYHN